jgi:two-component sensor histidine kinase
MSMTVHELCTNAVKYGALSFDEGHVAIHWEEVGSEAGRGLHLEWREHDGPPVTPPDRFGFGTRLIERAFPAEFQARIATRFEPTGVRCTIDLLLEDAGAGEERAAA